MAKTITQDASRSDYRSLFGNIKKFAIGALAGIIVSAAFMCLFALLLSSGIIPEGAIGALAGISVGLAAFVTGFLSVFLIKSNGLLNGAVAGIVFFICQTLFSFALGDGQLISVQMLIYLAVDIILAAIGGIMSVNIRK